MGFFDKVKKALGSKKDDVESQNGDGNIVNDEKADGTDFLQEAQRQEIEMPSNRNILFVCATNTTISPIAEAIFNQFSGDRQAFSAGLNAQSGNRASEYAIKVCQEHGIEISDHLTANINDFSLDDVGLILTSTAHIRDALKMKFPDAEIFTIKEYAGGYSDLDISDPFAEGLAGHAECFMEINEAVIKIIRKDMGGEAEEIVERPAAIGDEGISEAEVLSDGRIIVVSGLDGNLDYYNQYLSLWDKNDPDCHIVFLGNLIYSTEDDDGSLEILDDAIEKSQNYFNFHYLLGINELSCIMGENIYKMGINLKTKFENLIVSKKGSLEPYLGEYVDFFKKLPYFLKTENGLFLSYSGPSGTVKSLEDIGSDLNLLHDFLWARKGEYESGDVEEFLDALGLKFMVVGNMPCDDGYDVFSRQLIISSGDSGENRSYLDIDLGEDIDSMDDLVGCLKSVDGIVKVEENSVSVEKEAAEKSNTIKNFKYLDDLIHSGVKEIILDSDIVLGDGEEYEYLNGINLDVDDLVIDGNGHAVDACGNARIFLCTSNNAVIKNIFLKNGFAEEKGGAIYNEGNLTILDSTINNNTATWGGAIYGAEGELCISDSLLNVNKAKIHGGAIYNYGKISIMKSIFPENIAGGDGGLIYNNDGELTITESLINNNIADDGGAIYNSGELTVAKSKISNNIAKHIEGGAIKNWGKLSIIESIFNENTAQIGGAIYNRKELTITESTFTENTAKSGGVIYNSGDLHISKSVLSKNIAKEFGGVLFNNIGEINVIESEFNSNTADSGGVLCNRKNMNLSGCNFNFNCSDGDGGAIVNLDGTLQMDYCSFNENRAKCGGAISNNHYLTINDAYFEKNTTKIQCCQDIYNKGTITFKKYDFRDNAKSILNDGIIYLDENDLILTQKIENNGTFYDRSPLSENQHCFTYLKDLIESKYEIILSGDIVLDIFNGEEADFPEGIPIHSDNIVIDGNGHKIDAKGKTRIFKVFGKNIILKNIIIQNGYADSGAGIYNDCGSLVIKDSYLIDNVAKSSGGAIDNNGGEIRIDKTEFNNNNAIGEYGLGGAIDNSIKNGFGLIYCNNSIFKNNIAGYGGAIHNYQTKIEINGCEFINNQCRKNGLNISQGMGDGGALLIENSSFNDELDEKNSSDDLIEGEISIHISGGNFTCKKTKFLFKNHNVLIYNSGGVLRLDEMIFEDLSNSPSHNFEKLIHNDNILKIFKRDGLNNCIDEGPSSQIVYLDHDLLSDSKNFTHLSEILNNSNSNEIFLDDDFVLEDPEQDFFEGGIELDQQNLILDGQGHTINANGLSRIFLVTGRNITLKNIKFENGQSHNTVFSTDLLDGGAVRVVYGSSLRIIDCDFINNISQLSAGAIANKWKLTLENTKFLNNVSESKGGSINNYQNASLTINNCDFEANESFIGGALNNDGDCRIEGSNFTNNKSKNGGAIYSVSELNCNNCIFENNKSSEFKKGNSWAGGYGGAISTLGRLILKNTKFNGNHSADGGALSLDNDCEIENCDFLKNHAERGGAIQNDSNLNMSGCNFKDNSVKIIYPDEDYDRYGTGNEQHFDSDLMGASIFNDKKGNIMLKDSIFEGYRTDVIYNGGIITLEKCNFEEEHKIVNKYSAQLNIYENEMGRYNSDSAVNYILK